MLCLGHRFAPVFAGGKRTGVRSEECEKCLSSLTFMKVKQQVDIITTAGVCILEVTRAEGK